MASQYRKLLPTGEKEEAFVTPPLWDEGRLKIRPLLKADPNYAQHPPGAGPDEEVNAKPVDASREWTGS